MKIVDRMDVPMAADALWDMMVKEFARVAQCVPGIKQFNPVGDDRYEVALAVKVGPLSMSFAGSMALAEVRPDSRTLVIKSEAADPKLGSSVLLTMVISLVPDGDGTGIVVESEVDLRGKVASLGWGLIGPKSKSLMKEFAKNLKDLVVAETYG